MTFSTLVVHEPNKYLVLYRNVHRSARHVWRCVNVSQKPSNSSNNNTTRWLEEIVWQNRKNIMDERIFHIFLMLGKPSCLDGSVNKHIRVRYANATCSLIRHRRCVAYIRGGAPSLDE